MKKMGELMQEMGFRKDAPDSVKEAFIKHLIKSAYGVDVQTPSEKKMAQSETPKPGPATVTKLEVPAKPAIKPQPTQLEFPFFQDQSQKKEKVS